MSFSIANCSASTNEQFGGHCTLNLLVLFQVTNSAGDSMVLDWDRVRVFDREIAQMYLNMTKSTKETKVGRGVGGMGKPLSCS